MKAEDIKNMLGLECIAGGNGLDKEVKCGYVGDLLSMVMSHLPADSIWLTVLGHVNIVAVAALCGASCIVITEGALISAEAKEKADKEGIPILSTDKSSYETAKELIKAGI